MSENERRGLQRLDMEGRLPSGFDELTPEEKRDVQRRLVDQELEIRKELRIKAGKSEVAEHDLAVGIETVRNLDHERKIYSERLKGETGSGTYDLHVRGGDTKFIVPILIVIGVVVLGIVLIMTLR